MKADKDGGPAFPVQEDIRLHASYGMTLRDAIALSARHEDLPIHDEIGNCARMLGVPETEWVFADWMRLVAKLRYEYADAMLKERAK